MKLILSLLITMMLIMAPGLTPSAQATDNPKLEEKTGQETTSTLELVMVEEEGCMWCQRWLKEIGPIYPKSSEGKRAPLRRIDISDPLPDDIKVTRGLHYTPTFVLLKDGKEKGRIEGYPGEDFFWGLLSQILASADKKQASSTN